MAKSQMEIMGLVIIMILLTLGLLLVVRFIILKPPSEVREIQVNSQMASNLLNALLQTTTTCNNYPLRTLLQDCATRNEIVCDGEPSCRFANRTIFFILNKTLIAWHKPFNLSVSHTDNDYMRGGITFVNGQCTGDDQKEYKFSPVQAGGKTIMVELGICRPTNPAVG